MKILQVVSVFGLVLAPLGMNGQTPRSAATAWRDSVQTLITARTTTDKICNGSDLVCKTSAPTKRVVKTDFSFLPKLEAAEIKTPPIAKMVQVMQAGQAFIETARFSLCPLEPNRPICYFKAPDMNSFLDTLPRGSNVWDPQPVNGNTAFQSVKIHRQDSDRERVYVLAKDLRKGSGRLIPSETQPYVIPPRQIAVRKDEPAVAPKPKPVPAALVPAKKDTVLVTRTDTVTVHDSVPNKAPATPPVVSKKQSWAPWLKVGAVVVVGAVTYCLVNKDKCGLVSSHAESNVEINVGGGKMTPILVPSRRGVAMGFSLRN